MCETIKFVLGDLLNFVGFIIILIVVISGVEAIVDTAVNPRHKLREKEDENDDNV